MGIFALTLLLKMLFLNSFLFQYILWVYKLPSQQKKATLKYVRTGKLLDQGSEYATLLTDLSEAMDCLTHVLVILKLYNNDFDIPSSRLM